MIGSHIGAPIGSGAGPGGGDGPYQYLDITGYIIQGCCDAGIDGCMDVRFVKGNDLILRLTVRDMNGIEVDYSDITEATWVLKNPGGETVLQKTLDNGIMITSKIELPLQEVETNALFGSYTHEFTLEFNEDSVATVLNNAELQPASLFVRGK